MAKLKSFIEAMEEVKVSYNTFTNEAQEWLRNKIVEQGYDPNTLSIEFISPKNYCEPSIYLNIAPKGFRPKLFRITKTELGGGYAGWLGYSWEISMSSKDINRPEIRSQPNYYVNVDFSRFIELLINPVQWSPI